MRQVFLWLGTSKLCKGLDLKVQLKAKYLLGKIDKLYLFASKVFFKISQIKIGFKLFRTVNLFFICYNKCVIKV